jgi:hypothetical protein
MFGIFLYLQQPNTSNYSKNLRKTLTKIFLIAEKKIYKKNIKISYYERKKKKNEGRERKQ